MWRHRLLPTLCRSSAMARSKVAVRHYHVATWSAGWSSSSLRPSCRPLLLFQATNRRWFHEDSDEDGDYRQRHRQRRRDNPHRKNPPRRPLRHHGMEPETRHMGHVVRITDFGVMVRIPGCPVDGLVHVSQLSDGYVADPSDVAAVGDQVAVVVLDKGGGMDQDGKLHLSMRDTAPVEPYLQPDFQPVTVIAYHVPVDIDPDHLQAFFEQFGEVLEVDPLHMTNDLGNLRNITKITFLNNEMAQDCLQHGHRRTLRIPYQIGRETYQARVDVRRDTRPNHFRRRLLQQMEEQYQWRKSQQDMDPRMRRRADRDLGDMLPHWDEFKKAL